MSPFSRRVILWSCVVLGIGVAIFAMAKLATPTDETNQNPVITEPPVLSSADWSKGNPSANVILVEYSDLQCPACRYYYPLVQQLANEFDDRILIIYRHFPLAQHKNGESAAIAAEAAGRQGKFWEMHDVLFDRQDDWAKINPRNLFIEYAREIGIDADRFATELSDDALEKAVKDDVRSGNRLGVDSTPSFFLNGQKIRNPRNYGEFKNLIEQALGNTP